MALEPYRPPSDNRYRDELDREIDQKIDTFLHRWNWKLARFVRRAIIVLFVLWVAANVIPSAFTFVTTQPLGPVILQLLSVAGYLFVFIGFQFSLMYFFMARTRIYWVKPGETGISFKDYKGNPEVLEAATRIVTLLKGVKGFKSMGGGSPAACCSSARPAPARATWPRLYRLRPMCRSATSVPLR
jgi:hypothetical protein